MQEGCEGRSLSVDYTSGIANTELYAVDEGTELVAAVVGQTAMMPV